MVEPEPTVSRWGVPMKALALMCIVSLAIRVSWACFARASPVLDMAEYDHLAVRWIETGHFGIPGRLAWRTPGYPAFLSLIWLVAGHSVRAAMVAQACLGALTSGLVTILGARAASPRVGIWAGWLHTFSPTSILYVPLLLSEHVAVPLLVGVLLCVTAMESRPLTMAATSGVLFGFALLTRPALAAVAPGWMAVVAYHFPSKRWRLKGLVFGMAAMAFILSPWLVRNLRVGVGPTLCTLGEFNAWLGCHDQDWGGDSAFPWTVDPGEAGRARVWRHATLMRIRQRPGEYARLSASRLWKLLGPRPDLFVCNWAWPTLENDVIQYAYWSRRGTPRPASQVIEEMSFARRDAAGRVLGWGRIVAAPLMWLSFVLALVRWRALSVVLLPLGSYLLLTSLIFTPFRLREVTGPMVLVLMASALQTLRSSAFRTRLLRNRFG